MDARERAHWEADRVSAAYHEAGHAVIAESLNRSVFWLELKWWEAGWGGGATHCGRAKIRQNELVILAAGVAAQRHRVERGDTYICNEDLRAMSRSDRRKATRIARAAKAVAVYARTRHERTKRLRLARWLAEGLVEAHWHDITAVAEALLARTRLDGADVRAIMHKTAQGEEIAISAARRRELLRMPAVG